MSPPQATPPPSVIATGPVVLAYAVLAGFALLWIWASEGLVAAELFATERAAPGIVGGLAVAAIVIWATPHLQRRSECLQRLSDELRGAIGPAGRGRITALACSSGVAEELFFRGAMQGAWGLPAATLVFGLLHGLPGTRHGCWGAFALAVGLALALLREWEGSLYGAMVAHVTINGVNLRRLVTDPSSDARGEGLP